MIRPSVAALLRSFNGAAFAETCVASHYGYSGGRTASGERMKPNEMTAAHPTPVVRLASHRHFPKKGRAALPFGS